MGGLGIIISAVIFLLELFSSMGTLTQDDEIYYSLTTSFENGMEQNRKYKSASCLFVPLCLFTAS